MPKSKNAHIIVDGTSVFAACEHLSQRSGKKLTVDYEMLGKWLRIEAQDSGWSLSHPAKLTIVVAISPESEGQQRFVGILEKFGFETDVVDYRDTYVSLPPGRTVAESNDRPITSVASRISYIMGILSRHDDLHLMVCSHAFELWAPLQDLSSRCRHGRVSFCFFRSLLELRWNQTGVLQSPSSTSVPFVDLERHADDILGIDLTRPERGGSPERSGLSKF